MQLLRVASAAEVALAILWVGEHALPAHRCAEVIEALSGAEP